MEQFRSASVCETHASTHRVAAGHVIGARNKVPIDPDATAASYFLALALSRRRHIELPSLQSPGRGLQGARNSSPSRKSWATISELAHHAGVESRIVKGGRASASAEIFPNSPTRFYARCDCAVARRADAHHRHRAHAQAGDDRVAGAARS